MFWLKHSGSSDTSMSSSGWPQAVVRQTVQGVTVCRFLVVVPPLLDVCRQDLIVVVCDAG
jgi:hypothetical protein